MKNNVERQLIIETVFERFIEADERQTRWSDLDTKMSDLEFLEDEQLLKDAEMAYVKMCSGDPKCRYEHAEGDCFVPNIMLAILYILDNYDHSPELDIKSQYILRYFLSLYAIGEIFC